MSQNDQKPLVTQINDAVANASKTSKTVMTQLLEKAGAVIAAQKEGKIDLTGEADAKRVAEALANAEAIASGSIAVRFAELGDELAKSLAETGNELGKLAKEFADLTTARDTLSAEVEQLTNIKAATLTLQQILNAQMDAKAEFVAEMEKKKAELQAAIDEADAYVKSERERIDAEIKRLADDAEADRKRKEAEWAYEFQRKQQQDRDKLNDELTAMKKRHQEALDAENKVLDEREETLDKREAALDEKTEFYAELEREVAGFDEAVAKEVEKRVKVVTDTLTKDHDNAVALLQAKHESKVEILQHKVESLESQVEDLKAQLQAALAVSGNAMDKVQEIAKDAVNSAAQAKVVLQQQPQTEQLRK